MLRGWSETLEQNPREVVSYTSSEMTQSSAGQSPEQPELAMLGAGGLAKNLHKTSLPIYCSSLVSRRCQRDAVEL